MSPSTALTALFSNYSSQNSLRNPFVQNFIQTQTGIDVAQMSATLNQFCKFSTVHAMLASWWCRIIITRKFLIIGDVIITRTFLIFKKNLIIMSC